MQPVSSIVYIPFTSKNSVERSAFNQLVNDFESLLLGSSAVLRRPDIATSLRATIQSYLSRLGDRRDFTVARIIAQGFLHTVSPPLGYYDNEEKVNDSTYFVKTYFVKTYFVNSSRKWVQ